LGKVVLLKPWFVCEQRLFRRGTFSYQMIREVSFVLCKVIGGPTKFKKPETKTQFLFSPKARAAPGHSKRKLAENSQKADLGGRSYCFCTKKLTG